MNGLKVKKGLITKQQVDMSLKGLQSIVEGNIEVVYLGDLTDEYNIIAIVNEENKFLNDDVAINLIYKNEKGEVQYRDYVRGSLIFIEEDKEGGFTELTDESIELLKERIILRKYGGFALIMF